jgi:aspartate aminotransferase
MSISVKIRDSIQKSSWIRKMFEEGNARKAKYGPENVFDFSLGNPNLEPPECFKDVLKSLIHESDPGQHGYMPNAGFLETRQAVADYLNVLNIPTFTPDDIVMTVGAGGGLNVVLKTILNPGDEVVIPKPYFVEYDFYVDNHQGKVRTVPTHSDFSLDLNAIEGAFGKKTKAVLINTPNNPTGKVYGKDELEGLGDLLSHWSKKQGELIYLISDEPYRKIVYDGIQVPGIFEFYHESFVVSSFSKDISLPGERIGYVAVNPNISDREVVGAGLVLSNRILGFVNAPAIMQRAIARVMDQCVDVSLYQKKRDLLCDGLAGCGYDITKPEGAFYLFPKAPIEDDAAFVSALQEENILTVPGSGFGGPGYFRIAYCVDDETIKNSIPGFGRAIQRFRNG